MPKRDITVQERISLDALIDEAVSKCGPDVVSNVLKTYGATRVEGIEQDDYWSVISELQLLCSDS